MFGNHICQELSDESKKAVAHVHHTTQLKKTSVPLMINRVCNMGMPAPPDLQDDLDFIT